MTAVTYFVNALHTNCNILQNKKTRTGKQTHRLAAIQIQQIHSASLALEQVLRLGHDLRDEAFQIILLLEYAARQVQQYLIPAVLEYGELEELGVLDADAAEGEVALEHLDVVVGELVTAVRLVDYLRDADHVALVITDRHREDQGSLVAGAHVDRAVEARVLETREVNGFSDHCCVFKSYFKDS